SGRERARHGRAPRIPLAGRGATGRRHPERARGGRGGTVPAGGPGRPDRGARPAHRLGGAAGARGTPVSDSAPIPAFVNPHAGSAAEARSAIEAGSRFALHEVEPDALADAVRAAIDAGASRVLVAGGDGTIATAAAALADSGVELAVLPGGTLNHFARHLKIPTDAAAALEVAAAGEPCSVDAAYVNDRLFI